MKHFLLIIVAAFVVSPAIAETWPTRPIRFIVPFAPGGGGDVVGRIIGQRMSEQLGKPLIIDNRAGGGGTLGCELAAKAAPDGYTLLLGNVGPIAVGPALYPKLAYDPVRDFAPVTMIASFPNLLVANPGLPFKTVHRTRRLRKKPARHPQLRVGWRRHIDASCRRAIQVRRRNRCRACSL